MPQSYADKLKGLSDQFQQTAPEKKVTTDVTSNPFAMDPETKAAISGTVDDAKDAVSNGYHNLINAVSPYAQAAGNTAGQIAQSGAQGLGYIGNQAQQAAAPVVNSAVQGLNQATGGAAYDAQTAKIQAMQAQKQKEQELAALQALSQKYNSGN